MRRSMYKRLGLPPRILERAHRRDFGPCLTVVLIDRQDQVALKLYAAIDREKGQRHLKDLEAIEPTKGEMEAAVRWLLGPENLTAVFVELWCLSRRCWVRAKCAVHRKRPTPRSRRKQSDR